MKPKEALLELMRREGISQAELARRLGKSRQTVNGVLASNRSMSLSDFDKYASALGYEAELKLTRKERA